MAAQPRLDELLDLARHVGAAAIRHDEGLRHEPALLVGDADHRRLAHVAMLEQHVLDLDGAHRPPSRDDHIVRAASVMEVPVAVHEAVVLDEEPSVLAPHGDLTDLSRRERSSLVVDDCDLPAGNGLSQRALPDLVIREARIVGDDHADFGAAVHAAWAESPRALDPLERGRVHRLARVRELPRPKRRARRAARVAQEAVHRGSCRQVVDAEIAEGVDQAPGLEAARVRSRCDAEGQRRDGAVPEPVAPGRRRRTEIAVAGLEPDAVERRDHERHHRAMGVLHRLRQCARRSRRVLEDGQIIGGGRGLVGRGQTFETRGEITVGGDHAKMWEALLPGRGVTLDHEHPRPAVVETQRDTVRAEEREERNGDGAALHGAEERAVERQRRIEHDGDPIAARDAFTLEKMGEA